MSFKNDILNIVCNKMIKHNVPFEEVEKIKAEILVDIKDYKIEKTTTAIIPRTETADELMYKKFFMIKRVDGCTNRTLKNYNNTLKMAFNLIGKPYKEITSNDIRYLLAYKEVECNNKRTTCNNIRRYLSSFFGFLVNEGYVEKNPLKEIKDYKTPKLKLKAFEDIEIEILRNAVDDKDYKTKAIIEILLSTACRVSELVQIKIKDIEQGKIIIRGKGNKEREIFLNAKARFAINNYLKTIDNNSEYLFPARKAKIAEEEINHVTIASIEKTLNNISKKTGIHIHPHKFRRTWATNALKSGMDLIYVSKILGHENVNITQTYLDLDSTELKIQHAKYSRG